MTEPRRLADLLPATLRAMGAPQEVLDKVAAEAHNRPMTDHRATRKQLAEEFGVDDLDDIADNLYDDYLDYQRACAAEAHEEGDQ